MDGFLDELRPRGRLAQILVLIALGALVTASHWVTPRGHHVLHAVHVALGMMYLLPVVLAAVWFDLRGALIASALCTVAYGSHVGIQWRGELSENVNQVAAMVSIWVTGILSGVLVGKEKAALRDVAATHEGTLIALVTAVDEREHQTGLHSLRVRAYAVRLGREMDLKEGELSALATGALLHDVGKIGVPDGTLLKPGPLSDGEWRLMRKHPGRGERIVASVPFLAEAASIVRSHHERYDGSGYPLGLRGREIPLGARIFAAVDMLDALTSDRPYRKRVGFDQAIEAIRAESGRSLDPGVVQAFLRVPREEWEEIARKVEGVGRGASGAESSKGESHE